MTTHAAVFALTSFILFFVSIKAATSVCVLNVRRKIKDFLGLDPCNSRRAVGNLLWHHQIHDQPLILQEPLLCNHRKISGLQGGLKRSVRDLSAVLVIVFTVLENVHLFYITPQKCWQNAIKKKMCNRINVCKLRVYLCCFGCAGT